MEGKIVEYIITSAPLAFELMASVNKAIKEGYEVYGYPYASPIGGMTFHYQAMVKREKHEQD